MKGEVISKRGPGNLTRMAAIRLRNVAQTIVAQYGRQVLHSCLSNTIDHRRGTKIPRGKPAARIDCAELAQMGYLRSKLPGMLPRDTCDKKMRKDVPSEYL